MLTPEQETKINQINNIFESVKKIFLENYESINGENESKILEEINTKIEPKKICDSFLGNESIRNFIKENNHEYNIFNLMESENAMSLALFNKLVNSKEFSEEEKSMLIRKIRNYISNEDNIEIDDLFSKEAINDFIEEENSDKSINDIFSDDEIDTYIKENVDILDYVNEEICKEYIENHDYDMNEYFDKKQIIDYIINDFDELFDDEKINRFDEINNEAKVVLVNNFIKDENDNVVRNMSNENKIELIEILVKSLKEDL